MTGKEVLNLETLNEAYQKRLSLLHDYIQPSISHNQQTTKAKRKRTVDSKNGVEIKKMSSASISELVRIAKTENADIVSLLKEHFSVVEVAL